MYIWARGTLFPITPHRRHEGGRCPSAHSSPRRTSSFASHPPTPKTEEYGQTGSWALSASVQDPLTRQRAADSLALSAAPWRSPASLHRTMGRSWRGSTTAHRRPNSQRLGDGKAGGDRPLQGCADHRTPAGAYVGGGHRMCHRSPSSSWHRRARMHASRIAGCEQAEPDGMHETAAVPAEMLCKRTSRRTHALRMQVMTAWDAHGCCNHGTRCAGTAQEHA